MKSKTSITLSADLLAQIDQHVGEDSNRSEFIEYVLRDYFARAHQAMVNARELARINQAAGAGSLNADAASALSDQEVSPETR